MALTSIKLIDGGEFKINTHLTLGALRNAQIKGLLNKDFISGIIKTSMGNEIEFDSLPMDDILLMDLAYICYTMENKNPLSIDEFLEVADLNFQDLTEIYTEVLTNLITRPGKMPGDFKKATPKQASNGKKKKTPTLDPSNVEEFFSLFAFYFGLGQDIWEIPISMLMSIAVNKIAIDNYLNSSID